MSFKTNWKNYLHRLRSREIEMVRDYFHGKNFNQGIEFGCGDGFQSGLLKQMCHQLMSTDLNGKRLDTKLKHPEVVYTLEDADAVSKELLKKRFDFVFSSNLIEHLAHPDHLLQATRIMLQSDGYAVHVVPARGLKLSYLLLFYISLMDLFLDRMLDLVQGKKLFQGNPAVSENNINAVIPKKQSRWLRLVLPQIHGNYTSHYKEWKSWSKKSWSDIFEQNGFSIEKIIPGPVYSGYGFGWDTLRVLLEKIGFTSEHIFILRKKELPFDPYATDIPKFAVITPLTKGEYLTNTVLDGLESLREEKKLTYALTSGYQDPFNLDRYKLGRADFIAYALCANGIFFCRLDNGQTNYELAKTINCFEKTVFIDGSELKGNRRLDPIIQESVANGTYTGLGAVDREMLTLCRGYARREKPYLQGITAFPFGIEKRVTDFYKKNTKKDIDFFCIFGQDEFPPLRKKVRSIVESFCDQEGFTCVTQTTNGFVFDYKKTAGRDEFYTLLARSKVGISVSGGGYDTARFWEILGNQCILLTEQIDILLPESTHLNYPSIIEFIDEDDFTKKLHNVGALLRAGSITVLETDYRNIMDQHATSRRVHYLLSKFFNFNY